MAGTTAAKAAREMRQLEKRTRQPDTRQPDTRPADRKASTRAELETKIGFGAQELWTEWEFPDGSRLILNQDTSRFRVPTSQKDQDLAEIALLKKRQAET